MLSSAQYEFLLEGAQLTVQVSLLSFLFGTAIALVGGIGLLSTRRVVRGLTRIYVEVFRGVSAIILLFWVRFALPLLVDVQLTPLQAGVIALSINLGAYGSEVVRGAIQAVPPGQTEAGIAVNLTPTQRLRHVILPQALISMLPPYGNLLIEVLKASALVSTIGMADLLFKAQQLRNTRAADPVDIFLAVLVLYFVLAQVIALTTRWLERRLGVGLDTGRMAGTVK